MEPFPGAAARPAAATAIGQDCLRERKAMMPTYVAEFESTLFRVEGPGGWIFAVVPPAHAPTERMAWGRTPVHATVDGRSWKTNVWREKSGRTLLAVPKATSSARASVHSPTRCPRNSRRCATTCGREWK
jgi:hypothetical protein